MDFTNLKEKLNTNTEFTRYSEGTKKLWISNLKRCMIECYKSYTYDITHFENLKIFKEYTFTLSMHMKKNMSYAIYKILQVEKFEMLKLYRSFYFLIAKIVDTERKYKTPEQHELDRKIEWDEIIQIRSTLRGNKGKNNSAFLRWYIVCLYTYIVPLRQQDFINTRFTDSGFNNFMDLENKKLIIKNYKTFKNHGIRTINICDELIEIIKEYRIKFNNTDLMVRKVGGDKPMTNTGIGMFLKNIFGFSSSMLRKIFISQKVHDENMNVENRKKTALNMGHSLISQQFDYSRFSESLHNKNLSDSNINESKEEIKDKK